MTQVIGLFEEDRQVSDVTVALADAGFEDDAVDVLDHTRFRGKQNAGPSGVTYVGLQSAQTAPNPVVPTEDPQLAVSPENVESVLVARGVPEENVRFYVDGILGGGTLVVVDAGDRAEEAKRILAAN